MKGLKNFCIVMSIEFKTQRKIFILQPLIILLLKAFIRLKDSTSSIKYYKEFGRSCGLIFKKLLLHSQFFFAVLSY